jgi:hypothetical protein
MTKTSLAGIVLIGLSQLSFSSSHAEDYYGVETYYRGHYPPSSLDQKPNPWRYDREALTTSNYPPLERERERYRISPRHPANKAGNSYYPYPED